MSPLVAAGFNHFQDIFQVGSKLYIVINIDITHEGKNYYDHIFCHITQPPDCISSI